MVKDLELSCRQVSSGETSPAVSTQSTKPPCVPTHVALQPCLRFRLRSPGTSHPLRWAVWWFGNLLKSGRRLSGWVPCCTQFAPTCFFTKNPRPYGSAYINKPCGSAYINKKRELIQFIYKSDSKTRTRQLHYLQLHLPLHHLKTSKSGQNTHRCRAYRTHEMSGRK